MTLTFEMRRQIKTNLKVAGRDDTDNTTWTEGWTDGRTDEQTEGKKERKEGRNEQSKSLTV